MSLPVALLRLNALVFIAYGVAFTVAPESMSNLVTGSAPSTPSGLIDMRSTYGGMSVGLGVLLALLARNPDTHRIGLLGVAAVMAGMGASRILGLITDGTANVAMYIYLALEILMAAFALWVYRKHAG